jgi:hypothetical protein
MLQGDMIVMILYQIWFSDVMIKSLFLDQEEFQFILMLKK